MITEVLFLVIILAVTFKVVRSHPKNFPPGPWGLPLIGHLPLMGQTPHKTLLEWKKTYGPLIGVRFGSYRTLVINDAKMIREALSSNVFSYRPKINFFADRTGGEPRGLIFSSGQLWMEQRRFTMRNLRDFGYGTKSMESKIQDELLELMEIFKKGEGKPQQMVGAFNTAIINSLWSIMLGERKDLDDPDLNAALRSLSIFFSGTNFIASLAIFMPWLARIAPKWSGYETLLQEFPVFLSFLEKQIKLHQRTFVEGQPRDLADTFEDEARKTEKDKSSSFHRDNKAVLYNIMDLFIAGAETSSTTLSWLFAYLVSWPEVQKKLQKEIDQVVGRERLPCLNDRPLMPYLEAVLTETFRFSSLVPFSAFHATSETVQFHRYAIPKDTMVIPNLYAVHFDPEVWGDPNNFRPERFISKEGKFVRSENVIPFGTGKRVCLGESLARDQLFIFASTLFQKFEALPIPGKLPSLEPIVGIVLLPPKFEVILKERL